MLVRQETPRRRNSAWDHPSGGDLMAIVGIAISKVADPAQT
jgi:hypothetical protein